MPIIKHKHTHKNTHIQNKDAILDEENPFEWVFHIEI